jgi:Flp pilus assembly protein TadG
MKKIITSKIRMNQNGNIAIMTALLLIPILGLCALAIDIGYAFVLRNEAQNAADATALAAAACLANRVECDNQNSQFPNWSTAESNGFSFLNKNSVDKIPLTTATVKAGYWNFSNSKLGFQPTSITPTLNDAPAIEVRIEKSQLLNSGGSPAIFSQFLGIPEIPISAVSIAAITGASSVPANSLFPIAIAKCLYDTYWNSTTASPKLATQTNPSGFDLPQIIGEPYKFKITSSYKVGSCEAGQWTTFLVDSNSASYISNLIKNGNPSSATIGDKTWIQTGSQTTLYGDIQACSSTGNKKCQYVFIPVVQTINSHAFNTIIAFSCVQILNAVGGSSKYAVVQMSADSTKCQIGSSSGGGPNYGARIPPRLVY